MIQIRKSADRGHFDHGWLNTFHTFSFSDYHDPRFMGFRSLRVINEDWVAKAEGFDTHPHRDMEIITYVLEGALEHKDSMGTGSIIKPGEVQYMSAGTGVTHSEFNHSKAEAVHLLQIRILPAEKGKPPRYGQKNFAPIGSTPRLIVSADGADGSIAIRQDARIYAVKLAPGATTELALKEGRFGWAQIARGEVSLNDHALAAGDGAALSEERKVVFQGGKEEAEILFFDLN